MKLFLFGLGLALPFFSLAQVQQASIITRPGVATPPLRYHFDLSSALSEGVNQGVKAIISASNAEKTAVRFDSVKLFGKDGAVMGNNVASKTDALTANPYGFSFQNFGIAPADLANVDGIEIRFMDLGGENSTGKVTVQSVAISVTRDSGEACVIEDPIIIATPPLPPPTITQIQAARPLVRPGTLGSGGSDATSQGPNNAGTATDLGGAGYLWSDVPSAQGASDGVDAYAAPGFDGITNPLQGTNYGFSIPSGATINGIVFELRRYAIPGSGSTVTDSTVYLTSAGTPSPENKASGSAWPTSYAYGSYGTSSTLWGSTWTPSMINASDFGGRISVAGGAGMASNIRVDHMRITVYYTPLSGSVYDSFLDLIRAFFRVK